MKAATLFLQFIILLIGIAALAFLLWEPHLEGRNAHATVFQVYFHDPFLSYAYVASLPFFMALYQAFRILGRIRQNTVFSQTNTKALHTIQLCALSIIAFVAGGELFIRLTPSDDRAGGTFIGLLIALGAGGIAAAATMFERISQQVLDGNSRPV